MFTQLQDKIENPPIYPPNEELQSDWMSIVNNCRYTIEAICEDNSFNISSFRQWLRGLRKPQAKNMERMIAVMRDLKDKNKMVKHPSFGYATEEQIKRLNEIGLGPERDYILAQIAKQTKRNGKVR